MSLEGALARTQGPWAMGLSLLAVRQVSDDSSDRGAALVGRLRGNAVAPFVTFKIPDTRMAVNLQLTESFGARNAQVPRAVQLRLTGTWD